MAVLRRSVKPVALGQTSKVRILPLPPRFPVVPQLVDGAVSEAACCEFESHRPDQCPCGATWQTRRFEMADGGGSNPLMGTKDLERWPSGLRRRTANAERDCVVGSNPTLSAKFGKVREWQAARLESVCG